MSNIKLKPEYVKYLFSKASKLKTPLSGAIEISPICNMNCKMCYVRMTEKEMNKIGKLKTNSEWIEFAKEAKSMGTLFLLLTGGEPFLQKNFKELYIDLYNMGFVLSINTNATLINENIIDWLSKYPPMRVNVTLYGGSNETYKNLCNNPNGYIQATKGIEMLVNANIPVRISASMTNYNINDFEQIYEFANKHGITVQATTYMFPPIRKDENSIGYNDRFTPIEAGRCSVKNNLLRLTKEQFKIQCENLMKEVEDINDIFNDCEIIEGDKMHCRAGKSSFFVTWDGIMTGCGIMTVPESYPFKDGFRNAWEKIVKESEEIRLPIECATCNNKSICKVCAAVVITENGNLSKKPEYMCRMTEEVINETKKVYEYMF